MSMSIHHIAQVLCFIRVTIANGDVVTWRGIYASTVAATEEALSRYPLAKRIEVRS
jgi:hypothetical protein